MSGGWTSGGKDSEGDMRVCVSLPLRSSSWPPICPCHIFPQRGFWPPLTISPPPFPGKHGLSSCGDHSPVSPLQICPVLGVQGGGMPAITQAGGRAGPGVNHHHGRPSPFLCRIPGGKRDESMSLISKKFGCLL